MGHWEIFYVQGSHFDLGWCANPGKALAWGDLIIKEVIDGIVGEYPNFKFTIEYAGFLHHFLETYPEYKERVKKLLHEGKLEVCPTWYGPIEHILDGEALVRELVYGKLWLREELGYDAITAQHTDLPGHIIQIAQILAKCGIKYFTFTRYRPPATVFWWRSPDGSCVLTAHHVFHYGWGHDLRVSLEKAESTILPMIEKELPKYWAKPQVLMPDESDLLRANFGVIRTIEEWNKKHKELAEIKISTLTEFFHALDKSDLPTYEGEAPYGFYSIPAFEAETYREARKGENLLLAAEKFCAVREMLELGEYPSEKIRQAWMALFYPHDHNIAGIEGDINDELRTHKARSARIEAEQILHEIAVSFMPRVKAREEEGVMKVGVFNGLGWRRSEVLEVDMITGEGEEDVEVYDAEGHRLPSQVLEVDPLRDNRVEFGHDPRKRLRVAFLAEDVPSVGFKFFYVKARKDKKEQNEFFRIEGSTIETPFYRVVVGEDGFIKSMVHKELGQELVGEEELRFGEVYVLEDLRGNLEDAFDPRMPNFTGKIWREGERKFEVSSVGELLLKIRFYGEILSCPLEEEFTFYSHSPQVDVSLTIDWSGEHNRMVRVCFPIDCDGSFTYESPFRFCRMDEEELPATYRGCGTRIVGKWMDISNEEWGVTVGLGQGCCNMEGRRIEPVILRSVYCMGDPWYWIENRGLQRFEFRLLPHKGNFLDSNSHRIGWELNCPMQAHVLRVTLSQPLHHEAIFNDCEEFISLEGDSLVLTTVKRAECEEDFWAVRVYNIKGEECEGCLTLPVDVKEAYMANLIEEKGEPLPIEGRKVKFKAGPYSILTLLIKTMKKR